MHHSHVSNLGESDVGAQRLSMAATAPVNLIYLKVYTCCLLKPRSILAQLTTSKLRSEPLPLSKAATVSRKRKLTHSSPHLYCVLVPPLINLTHNSRHPDSGGTALGPLRLSKALTYSYRKLAHHLHWLAVFYLLDQSKPDVTFSKFRSERILIAPTDQGMTAPGNLDLSQHLPRLAVF